MKNIDEFKREFYDMFGGHSICNHIDTIMSDDELYKVLHNALGDALDDLLDTIYDSSYCNAHQRNISSSYWNSRHTISISPAEFHKVKNENVVYNIFSDGEYIARRHIQERTFEIMLFTVYRYGEIKCVKYPRKSDNIISAYMAIKF